MSLSKSTGARVMTIQDYLDQQESRPDIYEKFYLDERLSLHALDIWDNFLNDYFNENLADRLELSDYEIIQHRYNPRALSYLIYGSPEYWSIILRANGYKHPGEMDLEKPLKVPKPEALADFFDKIKAIQNEIGGIYDIKDDQKI